MSKEIRQRTFLDRKSARELAGMSEKQFDNAVVRIGLKPFTIPSAVQTTKMFWTRTQILENLPQLKASCGQIGRPKKQGPRLKFDKRKCV